MKTILFHLGFCLLVSAQGSYVTQQKICKQIPREICTESRVPVTKHLTEQKCSTIPTSRQECNLQQEKECYQVPEMKCFDEPRTTTETRQVRILIFLLLSLLLRFVLMFSL